MPWQHLLSAPLRIWGTSQAGLDVPTAVEGLLLSRGRVITICPLCTDLFTCLSYSWVPSTCSLDLQRLLGACGAPDILSPTAKAWPDYAHTSYPLHTLTAPGTTPPSVGSAHPLTSSSAHHSGAAPRTRDQPFPRVTHPSSPSGPPPPVTSLLVSLGLAWSKCSPSSCWKSRCGNFAWINQGYKQPKLTVAKFN